MEFSLFYQKKFQEFRRDCGNAWYREARELEGGGARGGLWSGVYMTYEGIVFLVIPSIGCNGSKSNNLLIGLIQSPREIKKEIVRYSRKLWFIFVLERFLGSL